MEVTTISSKATGRLRQRHECVRRKASGSGIATAVVAVAAQVFAPAAQASFLPPAMMDTVSWYLAYFIIVFVPIGAIVLFWMVHVLPEKIAHKRHHPQRDAIHTLCLLSLVFGGLLWPIAWLWAYTKPVTYRAAYGTDKHDDYFFEMGDRAKAGTLQEHELVHLREELDALAAKGGLSSKLKVLRSDLATARPAPGVSVEVPAAAIAGRGAKA